MNTIAQAQSIVGYSPGRPEDDFYPTPEAVTRALLSVEKFDRIIWEPACGNGAISEVLKSHGHIVHSTDLYYRDYGIAEMDFLKSQIPLASNIITNPPFNLANKFVYHAMIDLGIMKMALLCKLAFLEGQERSKILEETHLTRVHVFRKRIQLTRNGETPRGGGMIAFAWFVWEKGYNGKPEVDWI